MFFVEQISNEPSPQRINSPNTLNSTEISHTHTAGMPSISSISSPEPQIMTIHDNSNEPTMPYGFGRQLPIIPPSLNDLNLPPNSYNILATIAELNYTQDGNNDNYNPHRPPPPPPRKLKRKLSLGMSFPKGGGVSKPAVGRPPQQRTSQVHQTRIRTLKTFELTYELINL